MHPSFPCHQDVVGRSRTRTVIHMAWKFIGKRNSFYACYSGKYLVLHGVSFVFNYSLLVKRTSRPDGYRPDCKYLCENLYVTVKKVSTFSTTAFNNTLWTAGSILKYQLSMGLWDAMEGLV